jgi:hypothetical protein
MHLMGHAQRPEELDLGLGWLYYGLARVERPSTAVVIGSWRGFAPIVIGKALQDSGGGEVVFIDPSLVDDFWKQPDEVAHHFQSFGISNIRHVRMTTQQFVQSEHYGRLDEVGLLLVDGLHTSEQAEYDFRAFEPKFPSGAVALFHDSVRTRWSRIYGEPYEHTVCHFMDQLRTSGSYDVFSFEQGDGLTLVRKR